MPGYINEATDEDKEFVLKAAGFESVEEFSKFYKKACGYEKFPQELLDKTGELIHVEEMFLREQCTFPPTLKHTSYCGNPHL